MAPGSDSGSDRPKRKSRVAWIAGVSLGVILLAGLFLGPAEAPSFPVPVPNGYDDFLEAARRLQHASPPARSWKYEPDADEIRAWMLDHEEAFLRVRRGSAKDCAVPIRASSDWIREHGDLLAARGHVADLLVERAEFAGAEGRTDDQFEAYLDAYRYAIQGHRRGLHIDLLLQLRAESRVLRGFTSSIVRLDPRQCAQALALFQRGMAEMEDPRTVLRRDRDLARAIGGRPAVGRMWVRSWSKRIRRCLEKRSPEPLLESEERVLRALLDSHRKRLETVCAQLKRAMDGAAEESLGTAAPDSKAPAPGHAEAGAGAREE